MEEASHIVEFLVGWVGFFSIQGIVVKKIEMNTCEDKLKGKPLKGKRGERESAEKEEY